MPKPNTGDAIMKLFVPITKIDEKKREVYGRMVHEVADHSKEIFDYETSKPLFQAWSGEFAKNTDGKSLGNVRAMHSKVAAGKLIAIDFNDAEKAIDVGSKIVDDAEWNKVVEGVYTGFSIGGEYIKRWDDNGLKRYTAKPSEVSLVDNPCIPTATFSMVKVDGTTEIKKFKAVEAEKTAEDTKATEAETLKAEEAALDVLVKLIKDGKTTPSALVAYVQTSEVATEVKSDPAVEKQAKKGMYSVAQLASILDSLNGLRYACKWEAESEGDNSPIPDNLKDAVDNLSSILVSMVEEEAAELTADQEAEGTMLTMMATLGRLQKAGARHSKADLDRLQAIHDHSMGMGAVCGSQKAAETVDLTKLTQSLTEQVNAAVEKQVKELTAGIESVLKENADLKKRLEKIEAQPAPSPGRLRRVEKGQDIDIEHADDKAVDPVLKSDGKTVDNVATEIKKIHLRGPSRIIQRQGKAQL